MERSILKKWWIDYYFHKFNFHFWSYHFENDIFVTQEIHFLTGLNIFIDSSGNRLENFSFNIFQYVIYLFTSHGVFLIYLGVLGRCFQHHARDILQWKLVW